MTDDRCFRISESDLAEWRDRWRDRAEDPRYQRLWDSLAKWIRYSAPLVDRVIAQIEEAFADTRLDNGIGLFEANGLDDYASDEELRRLRASDEKLDWRRISVADLASCYSSPTFFDPQGFVFHLPAFLLAELNDKHPYGFIDRLYSAEEYPTGWRGLLTNQQRDAIIATLELIREHPNYEHVTNDIDASLQRYRDAKQIGSP